MSLSPAVLDAMLASGCTAEQIVAAVKAANDEDMVRAQLEREAEEARKAVKREADAARKRAEREAVRNRPAMSDGQSRTVADSDGPLSPPEVFPQTPFPNPSNPNPPSPPKGGSSPAFEAFWSAYPHKVGKADALKAFRRAEQRVDGPTLMAGLTRYVAKTDDRPWCNPSTWLNQDRWADQPATVQPRGSPPQRKPSISDLLRDMTTNSESPDHGDDPRNAPSALRLIPSLGRG